MAADEMPNLSRVILATLDTMSIHLRTMTTTQDSKEIAVAMLESHKLTMANFER